MSKQWGHGYHSALQRQAAGATMDGLWFHSRKDGKIHWQGCIHRDLLNGFLVVQLFDWLMGDPSVQKVVPFEDALQWDFYPTSRAMRRAWYKDEGRLDEFDEDEECIEVIRNIGKP